MEWEAKTHTTRKNWHVVVHTSQPTAIRVIAGTIAEALAIANFLNAARISPDAVPRETISL